MADDQRDDVYDLRSVNEPDSALAPFVAVLKQPSLLLLAVGVPLAIGLVVGVASSSALFGAGAFLAAILAPVVFVLRLAANNH